MNRHTYRYIDTNTLVFTRMTKYKYKDINTLVFTRMTNG